MGHLRLRTVWPFPEQLIRERATQESVKRVVVAELNLGQMVREVERVVAGARTVTLVGHHGGAVHDPNVILEAIMEEAT